MSVTITRVGTGTFSIGVMITDYSAERETNNVITKRPTAGEVSATLYPAGKRRGVFEVRYDSATNAHAALALLSHGSRFTLVDDEPLVGMTFIINGSLALSRVKGPLPRWMLRIPFQEVSA